MNFHEIRPMRVEMFCADRHEEANSKGSHPVTGRGGPRCSGQVNAPDFLDVRRHKCGRSSAICTGRLYPRRNPWYSLSEAESTSGHMVPSGKTTKKSPVTPPGIDPGTVRLAALPHAPENIVVHSGGSYSTLKMVTGSSSETSVPYNKYTVLRTRIP